MELWLDTIDFKLIEDACRLNVLTGVTTNPSILSGSDTAPETIIRKLLDIQPGSVAVQTTEAELLPILQQARRIAKISERIVIKIPAVNDGFRAIAALQKEGIHTLATAIFDVRQIAFAGMLGATYAAPYVGRIEAATGNAFQVLGDAQNILSRYHAGTKIMAAAIRTPEQFVQCAGLGIGAITLSPDIYKALFASTSEIDLCLEKFASAWKSNPATAQSSLFQDGA